MLQRLSYVLSLSLFASHRIACHSFHDWHERPRIHDNPTHISSSRALLYLGTRYYIGVPPTTLSTAVLGTLSGTAVHSAYSAVLSTPRYCRVQYDRGTQYPVPGTLYYAVYEIPERRRTSTPTVLGTRYLVLAPSVLTHAEYSTLTPPTVYRDRTLCTTVVRCIPTQLVPTDTPIILGFGSSSPPRTPPWTLRCRLHSC